MCKYNGVIGIVWGESTDEFKAQCREALEIIARLKSTEIVDLLF